VLRESDAGDAREVKEQIRDRAGVPVEEQRLFRDGQELAGSAVIPGLDTLPLMMLRSISDPCVTNLGHFRAALDFETIPLGEFTFVKKLASGIHGDILEYCWTRGGSSECVAVKQMQNNRLKQSLGTETNERAVHLEPWRKAPDAEDALAEIGILTYLARQPDLPRYLLRMLRVFTDDCFTWLVTEFADGGDLFEVAASGCVAEDTLQRYMWQLLQAVAYLHRHCIAHRDISLENILLRDGVVKLMDFGMAVRSHSASGVALRYFRAVGKDCYRAPEVYVPTTAKTRATAPSCASALGRPVLVQASGGYLCEVLFPPDAVPGKTCMADVWGYAACPADVFSCGSCLFAMAWQCPPWRQATLADPMFSYVHGRGDGGLSSLLQHWKKTLLSSDAMRLLTDMLRADPSKRPCIAECLSSSWFVGMTEVHDELQAGTAVRESG